MSEVFSRFDGMLVQVVDTLRYADPSPVGPVYVIRDLYGKIRLAVGEALEANEDARQWLTSEAKVLRDRLGVRAFPPEDAILYLDDELLGEIRQGGRQLLPNVFLVDRVLTGSGWWSVNGATPETPTYTLYSVKGGVGRSTTAAVLAWHLARRGESVLVVDLDLESPGISSAMLDPDRQPDFGVVDWFVEDLVGQGDRVVEGMIAKPSWHQDYPGDVAIAPAHGFQPGEYLAKLGRAYLDTKDAPWTRRLEQMLRKLREVVQPTTVLLESRSGLHDIAAATVTDLDSHALLFATDSDSSWRDCGILFEHWQKLDLARKIRERVTIVSGLTPDVNTHEYVKRFRERSWTLFQDHLYDQIELPDEPYRFAFDLLEEDAPHDPLVVHWNRGLAAGVSLRHLDGTTIEQAYSGFLARFDALLRVDKIGAALPAAPRVGREMDD